MVLPIEPAKLRVQPPAAKATATATATPPPVAPTPPAVSSLSKTADARLAAAPVAEHIDDGGFDDAEAFVNAGETPRARSEQTAEAAFGGPASPSRTAEARAANAFFHAGGTLGRNPDGPSTITRDAHDFGQFTQAEKVAIQTRLAENSHLENEVLAELTPNARASYRTIADTLANQPVGRYALQKLLLEGEFKSGQLLHQLAVVGKQPLCAKLAQSRGQLLAQLTYEVAVPTAINQQSRSTCTATTLQIAMASRHAAEYVRIVGALASPGGTVTLAGGMKLTREPGSDEARKLLQINPETKRASEIVDERTHSARLFQCAIMEAANGENNYDDRSDKSYRPSGAALGDRGIASRGLKPVFAALIGKDVTLLETGKPGEVNGHRRIAVSAASVWEATQERLALGELVPLSIEWGATDKQGNFHDRHEVLLNGIDIKAGIVKFANPWGQQETMPISEFKTRNPHVLLTN